MENYSIENVTDLTYLKQVSNGDTDFIKEMIEVYMQQTPEAIYNLEQYFKKKDWEMLRAVIHKMKPSFSFFGLKEVFVVAAAMEDYLEKEVHLEQLPEMISKIKRICLKSMEELENGKDLVFI